MNFVCKKCGYKMDTQECLQEPDASPRERDLNICLNCAAVYEMRGGVWCWLPEVEFAKLAPNVRKDLEIMRVAIRAVITEDLAFNQRLKEP